MIHHMIHHMLYHIICRYTLWHVIKGPKELDAGASPIAGEAIYCYTTCMRSLHWEGLHEKGIRESILCIISYII